MFRRFTQKEKRQIITVIYGHIALWGLILIGVFLTLMIQMVKQDIILMTLYASFAFGLLLLFSVSWSQLPFKKVV